MRKYFKATLLAFAAFFVFIMFGVHYLGNWLVKLSTTKHDFSEFMALSLCGYMLSLFILWIGWTAIRYFKLARCNNLNHEQAGEHINTD